MVHRQHIEMGVHQLVVMGGRREIEWCVCVRACACKRACVSIMCDEDQLFHSRVKQLNCAVTLFKVKQVRASPTSLSRPGTTGYQWHGGAETTGCGPNAVDGHIISGLQSINMPLCFYEA